MDGYRHADTHLAEFFFLIFAYDIKGLLFSVGMREAFRQKAGCFSSVGPRGLGPMRGSDPRVSRKQLAGRGGPTREGTLSDPTRGLGHDPRTILKKAPVKQKTWRK